MKRIRATISDGIDEDCNLLFDNVDILNAQRAYINGNSINIIPRNGGDEITIEFNKEILYLDGLEI
jgi:hypothetical protein